MLRTESDRSGGIVCAVDTKDPRSLVIAGCLSAASHLKTFPRPVRQRHVPSPSVVITLRFVL